MSQFPVCVVITDFVPHDDPKRNPIVHKERLVEEIKQDCLASKGRRFFHATFSTAEDRAQFLSFLRYMDFIGGYTETTETFVAVDAPHNVILHDPDLQLKGSLA